jgi:hypothetical protein
MFGDTHQFPQIGADGVTQLFGSGSQLLAIFVVVQIFVVHNVPFCLVGINLTTDRAVSMLTKKVITSMEGHLAHCRARRAVVAHAA